MPGSFAFSSSMPLRLRRTHAVSIRRRRSSASQPYASVSLSTPSEVGRQFSSLFPSGTAPVFLEDGSSEDLISLCNSGNSLFCFLRHYGCTLCRQQASNMAKLSEMFAERNITPPSIYLIGCGTPPQAMQFRKDMNWTFGPVLSDPSRGTYKALGLRSGLGSLLTLQSLKITIKSFQDGYGQNWTAMPTDATQQGGAVFVDNAGVVGFFHREQFAGDHAKLEDILSTIAEMEGSDTQETKAAAVASE